MVNGINQSSIHPVKVTGEKAVHNSDIKYLWKALKSAGNDTHNLKLVKACASSLQEQMDKSSYPHNSSKKADLVKIYSNASNRISKISKKEMKKFMDASSRVSATRVNQMKNQRAEPQPTNNPNGYHK